MTSSTGATEREGGSATTGSDVNKSGSRIIEEIGARVETALDRVLGETSASTVFGKPEKVGDRVIITAASIQRAGGFGFGGGGGEQEGESPSVGAGGGAGGGGGGEGRPVAVIEITPDTVEVRPILDVTKIGLTLLTSALGVWKVAGRSSAGPDRPWSSWSPPAFPRRRTRRQRFAARW